MATRFEFFGFSVSRDKILSIIEAFHSQGEVLVNGKRNQIRIFEADGHKINVKSFKKPNFINKIIYKFFRKSKARRSFEFAGLLLKNGIGTPQPIAFYENFDALGLLDSY